MESPSSNFSGPLAGLKVLELSQLIVGPFSVKTMADSRLEVTENCGYLSTIEYPQAVSTELKKWSHAADFMH